MDYWRERLRLAVEQDGRKQAAIAWDAGIAPETISRILNGTHARPQLETVARIARALGVTVGWLLNERRAFTDEQRRKLRRAAAILIEATK
jgi:transcriptional regulator with XRE-family HTH domain